VIHLLIAVADDAAFPMRRPLAPETDGDALATGGGSLSDVSDVGTSRHVTAADSRAVVGTGPDRAASWHGPILCCGLLSIALFIGPISAERAHAQGARPPASRDAKIASALTAGPEEIGSNATVRDWPDKEGESLSLLRQGTNGWVCLPDDPGTPGNDPVCMDSTFYGAFAAYFAGQTPKPTRVGYAYMLTSDAEGSNTDPTARSATSTNHWHHVGPHVMVVYPDPKLLEGLPTTPTAFGPYVMFPGTPIAHVMLPVASGYGKAGSHNAGGQSGGKRP
jgi:hypothetical protein